MEILIGGLRNGTDIDSQLREEVEVSARVNADGHASRRPRGDQLWMKRRALDSEGGRAVAYQEGVHGSRSYRHDWVSGSNPHLFHRALAV